MKKLILLALTILTLTACEPNWEQSEAVHKYEVDGVYYVTVETGYNDFAEPERCDIEVDLLTYTRTLVKDGDTRGTEFDVEGTHCDD